MIIKIFSVFDAMAKAFLPPFFQPEIGQATRVFADCCNSESHQFGNNPADYTLFQIGNFNQENGHIEAITPQSLGNGVTFVSPVTNLEQSNGQTQIGNEAPILPGAEGEHPTE